MLCAAVGMGPSGGLGLLLGWGRSKGPILRGLSPTASSRLTDESSAAMRKGSSFFLTEWWKDASEHNLCDCWRNRFGEELEA